MTVWWQSRSPRERALLVLAGCLSLVLLLVQGLIQPLRAQLSEARLEHGRAAEALDLVLGQTSGTGPPGAPMAPGATAMSPDELRSVLTGLAQQRGIQVSRLQGLSDGGLVLTLENVAPPVFFAWLAEARGLSAANVRAVTMSPSGSGGQRVSVEFQPGAAP